MHSMAFVDAASFIPLISPQNKAAHCEGHGNKQFDVFS